MGDIIDQQWVATRQEAEDVKKILLKSAAKAGYVIGIKPSGKGFLVTVEEK